MDPESYSETRLLFREAFDVDIEDKAEVRALAAVLRWAREKMEKERGRQVFAGGVIIACVSAFFAAVFANLSTIWAVIHGK